MLQAIPTPPPTDVTKLPYGTTLIAGRSQSTVLADIDFETYSEAGYLWKGDKWVSPHPNSTTKGLKLVGLQVYAEHPSTEVLCLAYNLKDGKGPRLWTPELPLPEDLFEHIAQGKLIEAFNAAFEERIWNIVCVNKYGFPELPLRQIRCAAAKARAFCLPPSLEDAAEALGNKELKDAEGKRLLNMLSIPRKPTKTCDKKRLTPLDDIIAARQLYDYCLQDIKTEAHISAKVPDLNEQELKFFLLDLESNKKGVKIDLETVDKALELLEAKYKDAERRLPALTEGMVEKPTQVKRIIEWLGTKGIVTKSIDEKHMKILLSHDKVPEDCKEVLRIRKSTSAASVRKLYTMKIQASKDGRVHDMFLYHGARTGRDAGRGVQPQNMPNSGIAVKYCGVCAMYYGVDKKCPICGSTEGDVKEWNPQAMEQAIEAIHKGDVESTFGDLADVLPGCVRGLFIADEGCDFICSDYSAIEAVVAAHLAGEQWRLEVFKNRGDIYLESISRITGIPVEEYKDYHRRTGSKHPDRQRGKIAELASGYGGGVGAWKQFGADEFFDSEDEIKQAVYAWREASPNIVNAWGGQYYYENGMRIDELYGLEGSFIQATMYPGTEISWGRHGVSFYYDGEAVYMKLPSGRYITYHKVRLLRDYDRETWIINFKGHNSNPVMGGMGWTELTTYGGKLFENLVQATARDIMVNAAVKLHEAGYKIVLRVHDELVAQVPEGWGSVEEFEAIASDMPEWAKGWFVRADGGWRGKRYRK